METRLIAVGLMASVLALGVAPPAGAFSSGITSAARPGAGCTCHGIAGVTENTTTQLFIMGLPEEDGYRPGETYGISVWVLGIAIPAPLGTGFNLEVTGGELRASDDTAYEVVQWNELVPQEATHSSPKQPPAMWDLEWTAPAAGSGKVTFYLAGNVVNGILSADPGDIWSVKDPGMEIQEATY